jgi:hypothetical protein
MKRLAAIFLKSLSPLGFCSSKNNFFLDGNDVVVVINLQKSNYDKNHFLNVGIWIKAIGGENKSPAENSCHIRSRADGFIDRSYPESKFGKLLNHDAERQRELPDAISEHLYPLIEKMRSTDSLAQMYREGNLTNAFINKEARDFLSRE